MNPHDSGDSGITHSLERADALLAARRPAEALYTYNHAERGGADPDRCAGGRWQCHMLLGAYEQAWQESDAIGSRSGYDPHRVWDGTPITGKRILVRSVHGFGDAVQMLRYMPMLRQSAARVIVQVAPRLAELAHCFSGIDEVLVWEQERPYDLQLELTELPYLFRSKLSTLPATFPYLQIPSPALDKARRLIGSAAKHNIGLVWSASAWDPSRSLPPTLLRELLDSFGESAFWSLQQAGGHAEWDHVYLDTCRELRRAGEHTLLDLAAAITRMDLVITVDTLAAHLAGALAKPVWVLLKHDADWRWMLDRQDSPWYPTMRLFRQKTRDHWQSVIAELASALGEWQLAPAPQPSTLPRKAIA